MGLDARKGYREDDRRSAFVVYGTLMKAMFRVTQFSDLHFSTEPDGEARNTDETWDVVFADAFCDNGSINTEAHLVAEDRWPSSELPEIACRLLRGEISYWEMQEEWHGVHAH